MQCYKVTCVDTNGNVYTKGVMTSNSARAMIVATNAFLEGEHKIVTALKADAVDRI